MAKRIDITEILSFEERPIIVVKGKEIEVNDDAVSILKAFSKVDNNESISVSTIMDISDDIFTKQGKKTLDSLKLNIDDYAKVVEVAIDLVTGAKEVGELQNDGTTL